RTAPGPQSPHAGRAAWRAVGAHRARDVLLQRTAGRRAVPQPGDPLRRQLPGRGVRVEAVGGAVRGTAPAPVLEQRGGAPGNRAERHAHLSLGIGNRPAQPPAGRLAHALRLGTGRGADLSGHSRRVVNALRWPPDDASLHTAIGGRESADRPTMLYPGGPFRSVVNAPRWPPNAASVHPAIGGRESVDRPTVLYPGGPFRRVVNAPRWPPNAARVQAAMAAGKAPTALRGCIRAVPFVGWSTHRVGHRTMQRPVRYSSGRSFGTSSRRASWHCWLSGSKTITAWPFSRARRARATRVSRGVSSPLSVPSRVTKSSSRRVRVSASSRW